MEALPAAVAGRPLIADRVWSADGVRSVPGRFPGGLLQMAFSSDSVEAVAHAFLQFASTARSVRAAANLVHSEDKKAASGTAGIPEGVLEFRLRCVLGLVTCAQKKGAHPGVVTGASDATGASGALEAAAAAGSDDAPEQEREALAIGNALGTMAQSPPSCPGGDKGGEGGSHTATVAEPVLGVIPKRQLRARGMQFSAWLSAEDDSRGGGDGIERAIVQGLQERTLCTERAEMMQSRRSSQILCSDATVQRMFSGHDESQSDSPSHTFTVEQLHDLPAWVLHTHPVAPSECGAGHASAGEPSADVKEKATGNKYVSRPAILFALELRRTFPLISPSQSSKAMSAAAAADKTSETMASQSSETDVNFTDMVNVREKLFQQLFELAACDALVQSAANTYPSVSFVAPQGEHGFFTSARDSSDKNVITSTVKACSMTEVWRAASESNDALRISHRKYFRHAANTSSGTGSETSDVTQGQSEWCVHVDMSLLTPFNGWVRTCGLELESECASHTVKLANSACNALSPLLSLAFPTSSAPNTKSNDALQAKGQADNKKADTNSRRNRKRKSTQDKSRSRSRSNSRGRRRRNRTRSGSLELPPDQPRNNSSRLRKCTLSDAQIRDMLDQREEARRKKDYARADMMRAQLKEDGVSLDDREREWRSSDGRRGTYNYITSDFKQVSRPPARNSRMSTDEIRYKLALRAEAQRNRDFQAADRMREEFRELGILIDDRTKTWVNHNERREGRVPTQDEAWQMGIGRPSQNSMAGPPPQHLPYSGPPPSNASPPRAHYDERPPANTGSRRSRHPDLFMETAEIERLLHIRVESQRAKDYVTADRLREELKDYGVFIDDRSRTWRCNDGRQGDTPKLSLERGSSYQRDGAGPMNRSFGNDRHMPPTTSGMDGGEMHKQRLYHLQQPQQQQFGPPQQFGHQQVPSQMMQLGQQTHNMQPPQMQPQHMQSQHMQPQQMRPQQMQPQQMQPQQMQPQQMQPQQMQMQPQQMQMPQQQMQQQQMYQSMQPQHLQQQHEQQMQGQGQHMYQPIQQQQMQPPSLESHGQSQQQNFDGNDSYGSGNVFANFDGGQSLAPFAPGQQDPNMHLSSGAMQQSDQHQQQQLLPPQQHQEQQQQQQQPRQQHQQQTFQPAMRW